MFRNLMLALAAISILEGSLCAAPQGTDAEGVPLPPGALFRIGSLRYRHPGGIRNSALSSDGKLLATAADHSVLVWQLDNGKPLHRFACPSGGATFYMPGLTFSPDGTALGFVPSPGITVVWDLKTGKEVLHLEKETQFANAQGRFTPDSKEFLSSDEKNLRYWDLKSGKEVRSVPAQSVNFMSPNAAFFGQVDEKAVTLLGDARTGKVLWKMPVAAANNGAENGVQFSPDSKWLALVHIDKAVELRTTATGELKAAFPLPAKGWRNNGYPDYRVGLTFDAKMLFLGMADGKLHRWDVATNKELPAWQAHQGRVTGIHHLADGRLVTTGADGQIRLWDLKTGQDLTPVAAFMGRVSAACSADGRRVVVGDAAGRLEVWNPSSGERLLVLQAAGPAVTRLAFTPDSKEVAAALASGVVQFWDVASAKPTRALPCGKDQSLAYLWTLQFSPDGKLLCIGNGEYELKVWDLATAKVRWSRNGAHAAFTPDGKRLTTAYSGPVVTYHDPINGKERSQARLNSDVSDNLSTVHALAFAPDGTWLAVAQHTGHVALCDGVTGREVRRFVAGDAIRRERLFQSNQVGHAVDALAFSSDGRWLATGGQDKSVRLWEVETGQEVWRMDGHESGVKSVAFGAGSRTLLSCGHDGQVLVWSLRPKVAKATLEQLWADLLAKEAKTAYAAVWALSDDAKTVAFLRTKWAPIKPLPPELLKQWIGELNSSNFKVRAAASRALAAAGDLAQPALEEALQKPPTAEVRQRLVNLLEVLRRGPTAEELRAARAIQALQLAGTTEARRVLVEWANGAAGARLTRAARSALTH